jgi:hypothetical protein
MALKAEPGVPALRTSLFKMIEATRISCRDFFEWLGVRGV